jgi:hypothetical protein
LALIRLSALRLDDGDFIFTYSNGHAKATPPVFQIRFKNRSTTRQYFNKNTGAVAFTEPDPLPLTRFGNAGSRQKPSEDLIKAQQSGSRITRLVSQIFV